MIFKARSHRLRACEHVAVVAAPLRLAAVEREVAADSDEGVLQRRAACRVGVDVAACHAGNAEQPRALAQLTAQRAVMARERALKFDPQIVTAEGR